MFNYIFGYIPNVNSCYIYIRHVRLRFYLLCNNSYHSWKNTPFIQYIINNIICFVGIAIYWLKWSKFEITETGTYIYLHTWGISADTIVDFSKYLFFFFSETKRFCFHSYLNTSHGRSNTSVQIKDRLIKIYHKQYFIITTIYNFQLLEAMTYKQQLFTHFTLFLFTSFKLLCKSNNSAKTAW